MCWRDCISRLFSHGNSGRNKRFCFFYFYVAILDPHAPGQETIETLPIASQRYLSVRGILRRERPPHVCGGRGSVHCQVAAGHRVRLPPEMLRKLLHM